MSLCVIETGRDLQAIVFQNRHYKKQAWLHRSISGDILFIMSSAKGKPSRQLRTRHIAGNFQSTASSVTHLTYQYPSSKNSFLLHAFPSHISLPWKWSVHLPHPLSTGIPRTTPLSPSLAAASPAFLLSPSSWISFVAWTTTRGSLRRWSCSSWKRLTKFSSIAASRSYSARSGLFQVMPLLYGSRKACKILLTLELPDWQDMSRSLERAYTIPVTSWLLSGARRLGALYDLARYTSVLQRHPTPSLLVRCVRQLAVEGSLDPTLLLVPERVTAGPSRPPRMCRDRATPYHWDWFRRGGWGAGKIYYHWAGMWGWLIR